MGRPLDSLSPQALFGGLSLGAGRWRVASPSPRYPSLPQATRKGWLFLQGDWSRLPAFPEERQRHLGLRGTRLPFGEGNITEVSGQYLRWIKSKCGLRLHRGGAIQPLQHTAGRTRRSSALYNVFAGRDLLSFPLLTIQLYSL